MNDNILSIMTRAQKRKQTPPTQSLTDKDSSCEWLDQLKVVETHITPKDSTELVFIEKEKLDRMRKLKNTNYESATFCYIPDKKTIYKISQQKYYSTY